MILVFVQIVFGVFVVFSLFAWVCFCVVFLCMSLRSPGQKEGCFDVALLASSLSCADTHGYVGADLAQLCTEAAMNCIREKFSILDLEDDDSIAVEILDKLCIEMRHFEEALQQTDPSALRETHVEMPEVHWDDVGGLEETKKELQEMVLYPVEHPEEYEYFNSVRLPSPVVSLRSWCGLFFFFFVSCFL